MARQGNRRAAGPGEGRAVAASPSGAPPGPAARPRAAERRREGSPPGRDPAGRPGGRIAPAGPSSGGRAPTADQRAASARGAGVRRRTAALFVRACLYRMRERLCRPEPACRRPNHEAKRRKNTSGWRFHGFAYGKDAVPPWARRPARRAGTEWRARTDLASPNRLRSVARKVKRTELSEGKSARQRDSPEPR